MVNLKMDFPTDFFEEEIRSGYIVSKKMKEVWAVELDLLKTLLDVCEKEGLRIFIDAGSLLGAVRHKGFIPWDDDIDMVMFRQDYDRLIQIAPYVFSSPYFLQSVFSDQGYYHGHAQFRNSETTAILNNERNCCIKYNQGIFLDIFVLDGVYDDKKRIERQKRKINRSNRYIERMANYYVDEDMPNGTLKAKLGCKAFDLFNIDYVDLFRWKENILRECSVKEHTYVAPLGFIFETEKRIRNKHLYDETVWLDFEFMKVPAPAGYDEFLRNRYGDYMKPSQVPTTHGDVFFDTNKSYLEYRN